MKIEGKFTIWQSFEIPDEASTKFLAFIESNPQADFNQIYDWAHEQGFDPECETSEGTEEALSREQNGGAPTIEAYVDNEPFLWTN
jgi:hypothetical protein